MKSLHPFTVCFALAGLAGPAPTVAQTPYSAMAPTSAYLIVDRLAEITLARSAAPAAVSGSAEILVLGRGGYVTAVAGSNGFTCLVERAWFSGLKDDGFWNPKMRAPICYNRQGTRSILPTFLTRTNWVLAGASQREILDRTHAAFATGKIPAPEIGSMTFMMSKDGYLGDGPHGPWHPHLMFYMPPMPTKDWGADLPGTWVFGAEADLDPYTMFFVPVAMWSDGSPDEAAVSRHKM